MKNAERTGRLMYIAEAAFEYFVAILVGGSFFGVAGMFFGVPILACLTSLCSFILESRLLRKDLPTRGHAYQTDPPARTPREEEEVPILDPEEKD